MSKGPGISCSGSITTDNRHLNRVSHLFEERLDLLFVRFDLNAFALQALGGLETERSNGGGSSLQFELDDRPTAHAFSLRAASLDQGGIGDEVRSFWKLRDTHTEESPVDPDDVVPRAQVFEALLENRGFQ